MSFSDMRGDGAGGRGVEKSTFHEGVIGAEILMSDVLSVTNQC